MTLDERIKALNDIDQEFDNDVIRGFGEALNIIDELQERIKELESRRPKWVSVEDRYPTISEGHFIVLYENCMPDIGWIGCSDCIETIRDWAEQEVTHWMPLPSVPTTEESTEVKEGM